MMNSNRLNCLLALSVIASLLGAATVEARLYRWVNENGEVYYSDRVPPRQSQRQRREYNESGDYLNTVGAAKTPEELARLAREAAAEAEARKAEEARRRRDRVLLETFGSVDEMQIARDERLAIVESHLSLLYKKFTALRERWSELMTQLRDFKAEGKDYPQWLVDEAKTTRHALKVVKGKLETRKGEKRSIEARFEQDRLRFLELKAEMNVAAKRSQPIRD